jgi:hypothetical protein
MQEPRGPAVSFRNQEAKFSHPNHRRGARVTLTKIRHMRRPKYLFFLLLISGFSAHSAASDCISFQQATQHVGENQCVIGKVMRVKASRGVHFLDFCEDQMACPFTVVVFSHDLKDVGDIRRLAGRTIEIHGPVKLYQGRAEIILSRVSQVSGGRPCCLHCPKTTTQKIAATTALDIFIPKN